MLSAAGAAVGLLRFLAGKRHLECTARGDLGLDLPAALLDLGDQRAGTGEKGERQAKAKPGLLAWQWVHQRTPSFPT